MEAVEVAIDYGADLTRAAASRLRDRNPEDSAARVVVAVAPEVTAAVTPALACNLSTRVDARMPEKSFTVDTVVPLKAGYRVKVVHRDAPK
jgi:hypothetical protein